MISVAEADRLLALPESSGGEEALPLGAAVGRLLSRAVAADRDGPAFDRVTMDGYAVASAEGPGPWTVADVQTAGVPPLTLAGDRRAVEVATGAVLPRGADLVLPYEVTIRDATALRLGTASVWPPTGSSIQRQGSGYRRGQILLGAGTAIRSPEVQILASVGADPVWVRRRAVWDLVATGDELVPAGRQPEAWQLRASNAAALSAEAAAWGLTPRGLALRADDAVALEADLAARWEGLDVLVTTGAVSAGRLDLLPGVLARLGVRTLFHRVAQRPGRPLWCGRLERGGGRPPVTVFALPGNPVSSLVLFRRYVLPWLLAFEGRSLVPARVARGAAAADPELTLFVPWTRDRGPLDWKGSGDYAALAPSSGFAEVPAGATGSTVLYHAWGGWS